MRFTHSGTKFMLNCCLRWAASFLFVICGIATLAQSGEAQAQTCLADGGQATCVPPDTGPWWWHNTDLGRLSNPCDGLDGAYRCGDETTAWPPADYNFSLEVSYCSLHRDWQQEEDGHQFGAVSLRNIDYSLTYTYPKDGANACQSSQTYDTPTYTNASGSRHVTCPSGYVPSNDYNSCIQPKCKTCKRGHHIELASGEESFDELDYRGTGAMPLEFRRYYSSSGIYASVGSERKRDVLGGVWHHTYQRSIVRENAGSHLYTMAYAVRPDGDFRDFRLVGNSWVGRSDAPERLSASTDAQGNITAWQYTTADDEIEIYNAAGVLQSISNRSGQSVVLAYSDINTPASIAPAPGLLIQVTDSSNRNLQLRYAVTSSTDPTLKLTLVIDSAGNNFGYRFDATADRLAYVDFPDGHTRNYLYNESGKVSVTTLDQITGIIDENNARYLTYSFDSSGRVTSEYLGSAFADKLTVTSYGNMFGATSQAVVTDALGNQTTYKFAAPIGIVKDVGVSRCRDSACLTPITTGISYDSAGYVQSRTDFNGGITNYIHDDTRGLETQRVEAAGKPEQRTTNTIWNMNFRVPDLRSTLNASSSVPEALTMWTYNLRGQALSRCQIDPAVSGASSYTCGSSANAPLGVRQWMYTYCEQTDVTAGTCPLLGLVKSVDGPRTDVSDTTTYAYYQATDESGCSTLGGTCHHLGDLYRVTNALGQYTTYVSYDMNGKPTRIQDANGIYTDMTYHARGWLVTRTVRANANGTPNGTLDATTTFAYDNVGNVKRVTQPDGTYLHYVYDDAHRLTDIYDSATPANYLLGDHIQYVLDAAGNRTDEKTTDPSGALKRELSRAYDQLSHLTALRNSANAAVQTYTDPPEAAPNAYTNGYDGNGNAIYSIDGTANHVGTEQQYDPLNRLVKTLQDHAGTGASHDTTTQYSYDARDNLRRVIDPDTLATTYTYDGLNNLTDLNSPDTGHTAYTYDAAGNRTTQMDARSVTSTYSYDVLNRLAGISYPTSSLNVTYSYDQPASGCYNVGRLTKITDSSGSTTYCYDLRGNVTRKAQVTSGTNLTTSYSYSLADRLASVTYPSGLVVSYSPDSVGRVSSVSYVPSGGSSTSLINSVTYMPFGPANVVTFKNGRTLTKTYDKNYAIDSVAGSGTSPLVIDATVDVLGNLVSASSTLGGSSTRQYVYDRLYRLTENKHIADIDGYAYAPTGDRTSHTDAAAGNVQSYSYGAGTHHLNSIDTITQTLDGPVTTTSTRAYDLNGNTTGIDATTFTYDDRNRLSSAAGVSYNYNGRGERVLKGATRFVYAENGQLLGEYNAAGLAVAEYLWLDSTLVGTRISGTTYYVETDQLGTPRQVILPGTTPSGDSIRWKWDYFGEPFGNSSPSVQTITFNLRFPGQYYDSETGLNYNYFRDYEAGTGRYVESDPIGLYGGLSTYAYAYSQPNLFIDIDGRFGSPYPPIFCQQFPRLCNDLEDCAMHPETCRGKFCRAGNAVYKSFCSKSACNLYDPCPILYMKAVWAESCYLNRLLTKEVCFGGESDPGHDNEIDIARAKVRGCQQLLTKCAGCFQPGGEENPSGARR